MVIEPQGLWEHNAYQSDTQFVVEVKPIKEDPNKLIQGTRQGYRGERLSLNFQNVEVRALLQVIADFTGPEHHHQRFGRRQPHAAPEGRAVGPGARHHPAVASGLDMRKNGNVILIAPREELATKEKLDLEARQQIADIEPLRTETFTLNYQKAEAVGELLKDDKQRILSKRGSALVDARTNKLFVQDTPTRLDEVRRLIQQLDIPVRQVLIEARIVKPTTSGDAQLGARFGTQSAFNATTTTSAYREPCLDTVNPPANPLSRGSSSLTSTRRTPSRSRIPAQIAPSRSAPSPSSST